MTETQEATAPVEKTNPEGFAEKVAADVKGLLTDEGAAFIRDPEHLLAFRDELVILIAQLDSQLAARRATYQAKLAEYVAGDMSKVRWIQTKATTARWRASAIRFRQSAIERLVQVKGLIRESNNNYGETLRLRRAIHEHRVHECDEACSEHCVADAALWESIK